MIKRIRDLTNEEIEKICNNNYNKYKTCFCCPLQIGEDSCLKYLGLYLDQAIEVEENDEIHKN